MNKRGLFTGLIIVVVLLVVGFFWFTGKMNSGDEVEKCVKVQTTCCPCSMGGEEKCVLENETENYGLNLSECSPTLICSAVFSCEIESCEYVNGGCVGK